MKDVFTTALSEVVQHQVELTSTIESLLSDNACQKTSNHKVDEVRCMLALFNAEVCALANRLAARHDENLEIRATPSHTDASSG